jgi:Trk K+ transport system NAD-binding subunit
LSTQHGRRRPSVRHRVRYQFDNLLSRGTAAVLVVLAAATTAVLVVSGGLLWLTGQTLSGSEDSGFLEEFWQSLLRTADSGTMAADDGWGPRFIALIITVFGILVFGTLIGIIAAGIEARVDRMQRGRSVVPESDHVVVVGRSSRVAEVVDQLTMAGRSRTRNVIAVLADRDPVAATAQIRAAVPDLRGSRLVVRSGDPTRRADLAMVGIAAARAVIVLRDDDAATDGRSVQAVLAAGAELGGFDQIPIVVELDDAGTAQGVLHATRGQVHPLIPAQAVARVTAFSLNKPGLSRVIEQLLDFRGADIRVIAVQAATGLTFGDLVLGCNGAHPFGLVRSSGQVLVAPPADTVLQADDRVVVVADDEVVRLSLPSGAVTPTAEPKSAPRLDEPRREHLVVVGWNELGPQLLAELEAVAAPGSTVEVIVEPAVVSSVEAGLPARSPADITVTAGAAVSWAPAAGRLVELTSIVLLADREREATDADSRTLLTLLSLRRTMAELDPARHPRVIAQLSDAESVDLAVMDGVDDYLVSDSLASRFITQLVDEPLRRTVLMELYAPGGASLHLMAIDELDVAERATWSDVVAAGYARGLIAVGWRRAAQHGGAVVLDPDRAKVMALDPDDTVIVVG